MGMVCGAVDEDSARALLGFYSATFICLPIQYPNIQSYSIVFEFFKFSIFVDFYVLMIILRALCGDYTLNGLFIPMNPNMKITSNLKDSFVKWILDNNVVSLN